MSHTYAKPVAPARAVVLGAAGFVGGASAARLDALGVPVLRLARREIDLQDDDAAGRLAAQLKAGDALVVVSARAPCKDGRMLEANIRMMNAVCDALAAQPVAHVVYISSDAVYADFDVPMNETAAAAPSSLHGVMHLARELMLGEAVARRPFAILRPTLIYGPGDPHNGYGPNRFVRQARSGEDIRLFGNGEERRDHVHVDDVAEIVARTVMYRSAGVLNIATGIVTSFRTIAETVARLVGTDIRIEGSPRTGPMPHNGYRAFDIAAISAAFSDFAFRELDTGLAGMITAGD